MSVTGIARSTAEQALAELRPLCEELPQCVIDPISLEPLTEPMVTRCGHTFERESLASMFLAERKFNKIDEAIIHCPVCRFESNIEYIFYNLSFKETLQHLKLINKIWLASQNAAHAIEDETISPAEKTLADIRPLCKELPDSAVDPISLEPITEPMVMRCGHAPERNSLISAYRSNPKVNQHGYQIIACFICKTYSSLQHVYYDIAFEETIDHLKKIQEVFKKYVTSKQT